MIEYWLVAKKIQKSKNCITIMTGWLTFRLDGLLVDWIAWLIELIYLADWLNVWVTSWLIDSFIGWLTGCLDDWVDGWIGGSFWLIGLLNVYFIGRLIGWLTNWFTLPGWFISWLQVLGSTFRVLFWVVYRAMFRMMSHRCFTQQNELHICCYHSKVSPLEPADY